MRNAMWIRMLSLTVLVAPAAAFAGVPHYSALYVFGDSYCDVGNLFAASGGTVPGAPYYMGRFSNGPLWVDHAAGFLGVPLTPSELGGTDYAWAGAEVTTASSIGGATIPSVPQQVQLYLSQTGGVADPNALYIIEGGGNDILDTTSTDAATLASGIAQGLAQSELQLRQAGATHFVIPNLFGVGLLPAAAGNVKFANAVSVLVDSDLNQLLTIEDVVEGVYIIRMNTYSLLNAVEKDPTHFAFSHYGPCLTTKVCADPDHTLFWDVHHPTEFGHDLFAVTLENALDTQP